MTVNDPKLPPEKWRYLFDKIGVEFGYRPLATRIGMDHTRLRRLIQGGGTTADAVQTVATAFSVSPSEIRKLRGEDYVEPFTLPDDAGRLTHDERDVIRAVVRALLDARGERDVLEADPPAGTSDEARQAEEARRIFTVLRFDPDHPDTISQDSIEARSEEDARRDLRRGLEVAGVPIEPSSDAQITVVRHSEGVTLISVVDDSDNPDRFDRAADRLRAHADRFETGMRSTVLDLAARRVDDQDKPG